jgi:hypothetical protein
MVDHDVLVEYARITALAPVWEEDNISREYRRDHSPFWGFLQILRYVGYMAQDDTTCHIRVRNIDGTVYYQSPITTTAVIGW